MANTVDSNVTGLRFAEEESLKVLPGAPIWYQLEPNSYNDFGGQLKTIVRNPINPSRQRRKGVIADLDASGGFQQDLTQVNSERLLQGFFFADIREKPSTAPNNGAAVVITGVDGVAEEYEAAAGLAVFPVNGIILASGFGVTNNNGVKVVTASAAGAVTVAGLDAEAAPPAATRLDLVGYQFPVGTADMDADGAAMPRLVRVSGAIDWTTLGLIPGEWIYVGGDAAGTQMVNNGGFARIAAIAAAYLEFDKTDWDPVDEVAALKTVHIYFGAVLKNENDPTLIKRRSYQLERTLGMDVDGTMSEYLVGSIPNVFTLNVAQADKITADFSFVSMDNEQYDGSVGVKAGARPVLPIADAFNTSSDFSRIKLSLIDPLSSIPEPLFAFCTDIKLTVNNGVTPNKAVGVLGAFDASAGQFAVDGSLSAYFASVDAVQAVRNNSDVTMDMVVVHGNAGFVIDIPLLTLGDGRLKVEQDKPITLPLTLGAVEGRFNATLLFGRFLYLPTTASA